MNGWLLGALIWWAVVALIAAVCAAVGVLDVGLHCAGLPTISHWLRAHPAWFWWPVGLFGLFLAGLAVHLYVLPAGWGGVDD